jgi:hypothetical protein
LFFAGDGGANGGVRFEPDQFGDVVFFGEAGLEFCFVCGNAFGEVGGDTQVEDSGLIGHQVDVGSAIHARRELLNRRGAGAGAVEEEGLFAGVAG